MYKTKIKGTGSYLPQEVITNSDLEKIVDTSNQWILERTGIAQRHKAGEESCSDMAYKASQKALKESGLKAKDIGMVLAATMTADYRMPNLSCLVKRKLALPFEGMAWDLSAACTGFVYALSVADQFIKTGAVENLLVVGSEVLTSVTNYKDRGTCVLFGDGAGAMVVGRGEKEESSEIYSHYSYSDGSLGDLIKIPAGGSLEPLTEKNVGKNLDKIVMKGNDVFKKAIRIMSICCENVLKQAPGNDVDWLVPHQANIRILRGLAKELRFPEKKVIIEIKTMGNSSAATVPLAFDKAVRDGRIKRGHNILITAFGGGLTSGSIYLKY